MEKIKGFYLFVFIRFDFSCLQKSAGQRSRCATVCRFAIRTESQDVPLKRRNATQQEAPMKY